MRNQGREKHILFFGG